MRGLFFLILSLVGSLPLAAEERADPDAAMMAERLPEKLLKYIHRSPERFIVEVTDEIASYGGDLGLGPAGIERMIASDRARVRARSVERVMEADLDNDGTVTRGELANLVSISPEGARGRVETAWRQTDADGDGNASAREVKAYADRQALRGLSEDQAEALRAYMVMDANGNNFLTVDEAIAAVTALGMLDLKAAKAKAKKDI